MTTPISTIAIAISKILNLLHILLRYWSCDASLSSSRDAMLYCRDVWSRRTGYATAAVTVGVILEALEVLYALKWYTRKAFDRVFMQHVTQKKEEPGWFAVVGAIGLVLVIVGVAGEWRFEEKLSEANATLANFDHQQTLAAEKEAGDAKHSAKDAATSAGTALGLANTAGVKAIAAGITAGKASGVASSALKTAGSIKGGSRFCKDDRRHS
jgi:hypothetical protein